MRCANTWKTTFIDLWKTVVTTCGKPHPVHSETAVTTHENPSIHCLLNMLWQHMESNIHCSLKEIHGNMSKLTVFCSTCKSMWKSTLYANWKSCESMWKTRSTTYKRRNDSIQKNILILLKVQQQPMQNLFTLYSLKIFNKPLKLVSIFYNCYCPFLLMVTVKTPKLQN